MKKKRNIVIVALVGLVALVGGTIAYHTSSGSYNNAFKLGFWSNESTESFVSPDNWKPCEETAKSIVGKNTGSIRAAARIKYDESWKAADGTTTLSLIDGNNVRLASVSLENNSDWEDGGDGWLYYKKSLDPGETTSPLNYTITFSCDANFTGENSVCTTANGVTSCTKPNNPYDGAHYHMLLTMQYVDNDHVDVAWNYNTEQRAERNNFLYDTIASSVNDLDGYEIDFRRPASSATGADAQTANGFGVNKYTERGEDICYYRGSVNNNYVIWANECWQIVRTTYTGGIKMIYLGPIAEYDYNNEHIRMCPGSNSSSVYYTQYNNMTYGQSPAEVGYMYGDTPSTSDPQGGYSNDYGYGTYPILGDGINGMKFYYMQDGYSSYSAGKNYACRAYISTSHYRYRELTPSTNPYSSYGLCGTGSTPDSDYGWPSRLLYTITAGSYFLPIYKYDGDLNKMKDAMTDNRNNSLALDVVNEWFENKGLDGSTSAGQNYEAAYLEDAQFCNNRTYYSGTLSNPTVQATGENQFAPYANNVVVTDDNVHPNLGCSNRNDTFSTRPSLYGNGKLKHRVGLLTLDEVVLSGATSSAGSYLGNGVTPFWTMSPYSFGGSSGAQMYAYSGGYFTANVSSSFAIRPVVSLKRDTRYSEGDGTYMHPYVIE